MNLRIFSSTLFSLSIGFLTTTAAPASPDKANLHRPLDLKLTLSGNFGELRNNHFHSGLDFKTGGTTGHKVYCAADGYVSRIFVSPWGFGRAVYVTHPELGLTTVYGHLNSFSEPIEQIARERQYADKSFRVDITLEPGQLPVKRGEVIARSGNTGSSGGPHLHMDVRDAVTEEPLDPMPYFKELITDKVAPEVRSISLFPRQGLVDGNSVAAHRTPATASRPFKAWGRIVPGIKAYDRMTGTSNIYGVKYLTLTVDGQQIYRRTVDRFSFDNTRALNTIIDYPSRINSNSWTMITEVPPSKPLGTMIEAVDNGVLTIDQSREYKCRFTLEDEHGNVSTQDFTIIGERQPIPKVTPLGSEMRWDRDNSINKNGIALNFPQGTFYDNTWVNVTSSPSAEYISDIYSIGNQGIPLAKSFEAFIPVKNDTHSAKRQYCVVRLNGKGRSSVGGKYDDGVIKVSLNRFGRYAVTTDTKAPVITPVTPLRWSKNNVIKLKISDNLSGIDSYSGEIDGQWILMELDGKTGTLTGKIDRKLFPVGKPHDFSLTVTDACGNSATFTRAL